MKKTSLISHKIVFNYSIFEWIPILILFLLGCVYAYHYVSEPKYWDDLLYIHTAWNMEAEPGILNRYLSIYFLHFFNWIAGQDPILGAKLFGSFTFSSILLLVYLNARLLAKRFRVFVGLFAVLFMLTFSVFTNDFGIVMADYTVTMMILVGVLIFLLYLQRTTNRQFLLFLFGLIFFASFKAKETAIALSVLIPGFLLEIKNGVDTKLLLRKSGLIFLGVLVGLTIFIILDSVFLNDPLFGLHISSIKGRLASSPSNIVQDINNNFLNFIAPTAVFLYSVVLIVRNPDGNKQIKWLWFLVLAIISFLNLSIINYGIYLVPRYITPCFAVLSILAAQIIGFEIPRTSHQKNKAILILVLSFALVCIITFSTYVFFAKPLRLTYEYLLSGILSPIAITIVLFVICVDKKESIWSSFVIITCLFLTSLPIATQNVYFVISGRTKLEMSRFLPFEEFKPQVNCAKGRVLISRSFYDGKYDLLSRDVYSSQWMFNLYYRCHLSVDQFDFGENHDEIYNDLVVNNYQFVFLDNSDYKFLENQIQNQEIFNQYEMSVDESGEFYFLESKGK